MLKIGDNVRWYSLRGNKPIREVHYGTIILVMPPYARIIPTIISALDLPNSEIRKRYTLRYLGNTIPRPEESYIVVSTSDGKSSKPALFWPSVKTLEKV